MVRELLALTGFGPRRGEPDRRRRVRVQGEAAIDAFELIRLGSAVGESGLDEDGEAATKMSAGTKASASQIPWREIIGMRNRLVHGYASVDHDIVWDVVSGDLKEVIESLEALLSDRSASD